MTWVGLQMLRNDRAKFAAMIVAVSLAVFLMQNQAAILATMLSMTAAQIRAYVDSGEPMGKAGAYGVQGRAASHIEHIRGSYSGIMGLPLFETAQLLRQCGVRC